MTAAQVADLLQVTSAWVRSQARAGVLPCHRLGKYLRFSRAEVTEWFANA
ncbi:unnamed protein product [marine sediment metagenome]|uniref:Helix-turn-helix domain-containing protein n=1 Tax=marine sediment metagenome TaxID=412755 RepID=X1F1J7_9ZZZZ